MRLDAFLTQAPMATAVSGSSMPQASVLSANARDILLLHTRRGGTRVQEGVARGCHQPVAISLQARLVVKPVSCGLLKAKTKRSEALQAAVQALDKQQAEHRTGVCV